MFLSLYLSAEYVYVVIKKTIINAIKKDIK